MASIHESKYAAGTGVVFKDEKQLSSIARTFVIKNGYKPNTTILKKINQPNNIQSKKILSLDLGRNEEVVYFTDPKNNVVIVNGSGSQIKGTFNHVSGSRSETNKKTELKELISMWVFQSSIEQRRILTEDQIIERLTKEQQGLYDTVYYDSAIKQNSALSSFGTDSGYLYELQARDITKDIYSTAARLTKRSVKDYWNPADVWLIRRQLDIGKLVNSTTINELNSRMGEYIKTKDVLPISLKQVTAQSASVTVVSSSKTSIPQPKNLKIATVESLTPEFNNFFIYTQSGFGVRVGTKAGTDDMYIEGKWKNMGTAIGAVDARDYRDHVLNIHGYTTRRSGDYGSDEIVSRELQLIYQSGVNISSKVPTYTDAITIYNQADIIKKKRMSKLISYLFSFLIVPPDFGEHMAFCYYSSHKISNVGSPYILIK